MRRFTPPEDASSGHRRSGREVWCLAAVADVVKKDVGGLQAVLAVLKQEQWISHNVAADVRIAGYSKRRSGGAARREPYTEAMMVKLFASPMYTGCLGEGVSKRAKPGPSVYQDALYWLPLFGATGGPRLEEVGQARLDDVETINFSDSKQPNTGTCTILHITNAGQDQRLKTDGSKRVLIVHPELIKLGFLDYVAQRRAAGAERLFVLTRSNNEKWTKELSRQLNRYLDATVTDDPRYVFYSLRHEFKDCADDSGIDPKLSDKITGHAPGSVGAGYGRGASIRKLALEINKLDTSYIDWSRLRRAAGR